jgi:hypothetical protein
MNRKARQNMLNVNGAWRPNPEEPKHTDARAWIAAAKGTAARRGRQKAQANEMARRHWAQAAR